MTENKQKEDMPYIGRDLEAMFFAQNYHRWILAEFKPFIGKIIAEVGGGSGNFSELLLETNLISELTILEPSSDMYRRLQTTMTGRAAVKTLQAFLRDEAVRYQAYFDTLFYVNVLEHVEHEDAELRLIHTCLQSGGHLCLFVPALPWLYSDFDRDIGHFRRYRKGTLTDRLVQNGFEVVKIKYMDFIGIFGWYFFYVLLGKKMKAGEVRFYDTYLVPLTKLMEKIIHPPIGKNLLVVAKKRGTF
jgi:SAM-dependent methyltransferase